jgi:hypothetical protein
MRKQKSPMPDFVRLGFSIHPSQGSVVVDFRF